MKEVLNYIKENWQNTIRAPQNGVPYPFTSPTINEAYHDFFYWDTYFINIGLLLEKNVKQVENNLNNIAHFINELGYMPNSNILINRTQPPFFTRAVYDFWKYTKDLGVVTKYIDSIIKEQNFFEEHRKNKDVGLNAYGCHDTYDGIMLNYRAHHNRVQESSDDPKMQERIGKEIIIIAESGLDFNMRFRTDNLKIAASEFVHLDLNCILYDAERKTSEMLMALGDHEKARLYSKKAEKRKELINKYLLKDGIYLDYNFVNNTHSRIASAASLYPYIFGISTDPIGCKKILDGIELQYGVTTCPYRGEDVYYQWDYPAVWGEMNILTYWALINCGLIQDANRIAQKFVNTVDRVYLKTHKIYEKYDGITGDICNVEYDAPEMMGWTAAAYSYFHYLKK